MSEYTKGEWMIGKHDGYANIHQSGLQIAMVTGKNHLADAHRIVKCVNNWDTLIELHRSVTEKLSNAIMRIEELEKIDNSQSDLLEACEEAQKVFGFIAENYKSAPHFPNAERLVEAAIDKATHKP